MKLQFTPVKIVFALAFIATIIGFSSFRQKPKEEIYSFRNQQPPTDDDTTRKRNRNWSDREHDKIEQEMKRLDLEMKKLDEEMQKFDETNYLMANDALKQVDLEKVLARVDEAIKNIDWEKIDKDLEEDMVAANKIKIAEVQKELQKVKGELLKQKISIRINAGKMDKEVKNELINARKSIESTKQELRNVKEFTDALEKDNLINKSKAYKVEVRNGELFIDGKKQPQEVSDKFRKYYRKNNFTISMAADDDFVI